MVLEEEGVLGEVDGLERELAQPLAPVGVGRRCGGDAAAAELGARAVLLRSACGCWNGGEGRVPGNPWCCGGVELMRMAGDLFSRCSLLHSRTDSGEWNGCSSTMANPDFHIEKLRQHACHHVTRRSFAIEFAVELGGLLEMALQIKAFMYSALIESSS
jgi:hypothetical protein